MIWRPRSLTHSRREERRPDSARLLQAGQLSLAEIASRMDLGRRAVSTWVKHFRQHPDDRASLQHRPMLGRPPRLTAAQWPHILPRLTQGAVQAGFQTERSGHGSGSARHAKSRGATFSAVLYLLIMVGLLNGGLFPDFGDPNWDKFLLETGRRSAADYAKLMI